MPNPLNIFYKKLKIQEKLFEINSNSNFNSIKFVNVFIVR